MAEIGDENPNQMPPRRVEKKIGQSHDQAWECQGQNGKHRVWLQSRDQQIQYSPPGII